MTTQPQHDRLDTRPFWQVQAVFDPDGGGGDFAYTIGLFTKGHPELHLWARPSRGEDPGHDWKLSSTDCCRILNEFAELLLRGELGVGSSLRREYDGGLARVEFRVCPPGDHEELEAYGVPAGVDVLPVRWSLHREPEGDLTPLPEEGLARARASYDELVDGLDHAQRAPRGWALPKELSFEAEQRFGPLTALVLARAAQIWQADVQQLATFVNLCMRVGIASSLSWPQTRAFALARPVGRSTVMATLRDQVHELGKEFTRHPLLRTRWNATMNEIWGEELSRLSAEERRRATSGCLGHLEDGIAAVLSVQAVADVADLDLWLYGLGPWQAAQVPAGVAAGQTWHASPSVLAEARSLLGSLLPGPLLAVGALHDRALSKPASTSPSYDDVESVLTGWAVISAAACPDLSVLLAGTTTWDQIMSGLGLGQSRFDIPSLQMWATCLTSALTHRARLSAEDVHAFARPFLAVLPGLETLLNTPL